MNTLKLSESSHLYNLRSSQIQCTTQPLYVPPCSLCVIENALGHVTVDEWLFRIRPELGPRGNATVTTPNCLSSVYHLCVYVLICDCKCICICMCVCLHSAAQSSVRVRSGCGLRSVLGVR